MHRVRVPADARGARRAAFLLPGGLDRVVTLLDPRGGGDGGPAALPDALLWRVAAGLAWDGGPTVIAGHPDGLGGTGAAELRLPWSVFVDSHKRVYVSDRGLNCRVQRFDAALPGAALPAAVTVAGGHGKGPGLDQLNDPNGLDVVEEEGFAVYVADCANNRVVRWVAGAGELVAGGEYGMLRGPTDVKVDRRSGAAVIASEDGPYLVLWPRGARQGVVLETMNSPQSLALLGNGDIVYGGEHGAVYHRHAGPRGPAGAPAREELLCERPGAAVCGLWADPDLGEIVAVYPYPAGVMHWRPGWAAREVPGLEAHLAGCTGVFVRDGLLYVSNKDANHVLVVAMPTEDEPAVDAGPRPLAER